MKISAIFLLILFVTGTSDGAVKLACVDERPTQSSFASKYNWATNLTIHTRMAIGESEGFLLMQNSDPKDKLTVSFGNLNDSVKLRLFRVENVSLAWGGKVPDILVPVNSGEIFSPVNGKQLFYLRVTSLPQAMAGKFISRVSFKNGGKDEVILKLEIEIAPVHIPTDTPVTIQGTVWPINNLLGNGDSQYLNAKIKDILLLMSEYRFNGAAGMWGSGLVGNDHRLFADLVAFCLDDLHFKRVRIPSNKWYNWKKPMLVEYAERRPDEAELTDQIRKHLLQFQTIIDNKKWVGRLGLKIWDEPREKDYPDVALIYRAAKKAAPSLNLELSEQPATALDNIADVWTIHIDYFRPEYVEAQHRLGKEVWLYANKVHMINESLQGMRILGWLLWRYNLDGYLFWAVNWWNEDPWSTVSSYKKDYFKAGTFFYPDAKTGQIYPSLRLEAFRDGIEDMLLLRELEKKSKGNSNTSEKARYLLSKLRTAYNISDINKNVLNPAIHKQEILDALVK